MATIPEVRDRLRSVAAELRMFGLDRSPGDIADELDALAEETKRRPNGNRAKAPVASASVTPEIAEAIRAYKLAYPHATMFAIGAVFRVNQGRVSEALYGKRT